MKRILILLAVAAVALGACASDQGTPDIVGSESLPPDDAASSFSDEAPIPVEPNEGIGDAAEPLDHSVVSTNLADEVEIALADLTQRIGSERVIEVVAAHELTWPNGSLGCPQPDMSYTQALVDGYRIEFADGGFRFIYHGEVGADPFLCVEGDEGSPELVPSAVAPAAPGVEVLPTNPAKDDEPTEQFGGQGGPPDE